MTVSVALSRSSYCLAHARAREVLKISRAQTREQKQERSAILGGGNGARTCQQGGPRPADMVEHDLRVGKGPRQVDKLSELGMVHPGVEAEAKRSETGEALADLGVWFRSPSYPYRGSRNGNRPVAQTHPEPRSLHSRASRKPEAEHNLSA